MRLRGVERFHCARDVDEALSLLHAYRGAGALLAGGVDLARMPRLDLKGLIDITAAGLGHVRLEDDGLHVGATATLSQLLDDPRVRRHVGGFLARVLSQVAVRPLRNVATLGGAVVSGHPWADIPTALVAVGAEISWTGDRPERASLEETYEGPFRKVFQRAVLTEVRLPVWDGAFAFQKIARNATDIALLNCACGLGIAGGRVAWARVAVGATPARGHRLPWLEDALVGETSGQDLWREAGRAVEGRLRVGDDRRAGADWRRAAAGTLVRRALAEAAERAAQG
ncbi:MAG: FAD binding domain-containing protein [Candidatus Bipolaricaulaceae bacterium]